MWWLRLKRLMMEREVFIGLIIFGVVNMLASLIGYIGWSGYAAIIQGIGLLLLVGLLIVEILLRRKRKPLAVPVMFTEQTDRDKARDMFNRFVQTTNLNSAVKVLTSMFNFQQDDLIIQLSRPAPRVSYETQDWTNAWDELLRGWEQELDRKSTGDLFVTEGRCYHIFPHITLPLAFALGASVGLRRSLVLYHNQEERFYRYPVLDLSHPREIFDPPDDTVPQPKVVPENPDALPKANKLILHIFISARHSPDFRAHPDYLNAVNVALNYSFDLNPEANWLPYVRWIFRKAKPLIDEYEQVEICLSSPSVIAFALGMAFSWSPHLTVCHFFDDKRYRPVFQLAQTVRPPHFS